jgi:DNA mismatch repair ATPase MutS
MLRSMGIAAVLAQAGAPVCAANLRMSSLAVRTSMRVDDSLERGVSHFYAELERLKLVAEGAEGAEGAPPLLFLLDEILHGTNSRERHLGATAVVRHLLDKGAIGAVSTHDLGLVELERESGGRIQLRHFEELVEDGKMTFDYKLKPGVVTTTNALRLMRMVGLPV